MKKKITHKKSLSLVEVREACGMTQEQFALLCGVDRTLLSHWERGRRSIPAQAKKLMTEVVKLMATETPEEKGLMSKYHQKYAEKWRHYFLGRLYLLTEELDRVRSRRDEAERLYHLRMKMAAKIEAVKHLRVGATDHTSENLVLFCRLAHKSIHDNLKREPLEEMLRLQLAVATLQFQLRQLGQWIVGEEKKSKPHKPKASGLGEVVDVEAFSRWAG